MNRFSWALAWHAFAVTSTLAATPNLLVAGQVVLRVKGTTGACETCHITFEHVATLGLDEKGEGEILTWPYPSTMVRDSQGRFILAMPESGGEMPHVYRPDGRFLRTIGTKGKGPGEFSAPGIVALGPGDSIYVWDKANRRLTTYSPQLELGWSQRTLGYVWSAIVLPNAMVVGATPRDRDRIGLPLHEFDPAGVYLRSYGLHGEAPIENPRDPTKNLRWVRPLRADTFLVASYTHEYSLEIWTLGGQLLRRFERDANWFRPYEAWWLPTSDRPPAPVLMDVWKGPGRLLWVFAMIPDDNWREGLGKPVLIEGTTSFPIERYEQLFDAMIEVINLDDGTLITSQRFDELYWGIIGKGGEILAPRETTDGRPYVEVVRALLVSDKF